MARDWFKLVSTTVKKESAKFTDAKSKSFNTLSASANKKILSKYSDKKIKQLVESILKTTDKVNSKSMSGKVAKIIGLSQESIAGEINDDINTDKNVAEVVKWIAKLKDDSLKSFNAATVKAIREGKGVDHVADQFKVVTDQRKNHAKMVARTQVASYNSITNNLRAQNLGIEEAIWITGGDERVRKSHKDRHGKTFRLDKGLYSSIDKKWLLPGTDFQCRCSYKMIIPEGI